MKTTKFAAIFLVAGLILSIGCAVSQPGSHAILATQPDSMDFSYTIGGPKPPSQTINIKNAGEDEFAWRVGTNAQWMQIGPINGSCQRNEVHDVSVSVRTTDVPVGTYSATIAIIAEGPLHFNDEVSIPVTYTVRPSELQPVLGTQPSSLSFTATAGGPNPPSQKIGISNVGPQGSQMHWKVGTKAQWMQLGAESGISNGNEIEEVSVTVTTKGVPAGTYNANIIIAAQGAANSPVSIPVTYTVRSQ